MIILYIKLLTLTGTRADIFLLKLLLYLCIWLRYNMWCELTNIFDCFAQPIKADNEVANERWISFQFTLEMQVLSLSLPPPLILFLRKGM